MQTLKKKSDSDLEKDLATTKKSIREFRFGVAGSKVKNIKEARNLRRHAAQILTELTLRSKTQ